MTTTGASLGNVSAIGNARIAHSQGFSANPEVPLSMEEAAQFNFDLDSIAFEDLADWLPMEGGLDNNVFMDSIYGLANRQF
jgi:transcription elongation factor SPT5